MSPVADMTEELLDSFLATLDSIKQDAEHCVKMFNSWKRMHRADPTNADLKQEVKDVVDEMETAFRAYRAGIAEKTEQFQLSASAPVVGNISSSAVSTVARLTTSMRRWTPSWARWRRILWLP